MRPVLMHALGIDLGTSGLKVALFDAGGLSKGAVRRPVATRHGPGAAAEQDAEALWQGVVEAVREVVAASNVAPDRIAAIGCAAQYSSLVAVDAAARPVSPLLTWMDRRGGDHARAIRQRHPQAVETWRAIHGLAPLPHGGDSLGHALYLQHDRPQAWRRTASVLEPVDYLTARMTGRLAATQGSMFMSLLVDNRRRGVTDYDGDLVAMAGIDPDRLPELVPLDVPLGALCAEASEALGLPRGVQVLPGLNDTQALALATGSLAGERGGLCIGTTSVLVTHLGQRAEDPERALFSMPGPLEEGYVVMAENGIGGRALDHFLGSVVHASDALGDHASADVYAGLEDAVAHTAPGAGGVLFLPWLDGALAPRPKARMRGGFLNVSLGTTREQMLRAVLEGVAHNLRWLLAPVERLAGHGLSELALAGGGARSDGWAQILADVLERPVRRLQDPSHANCRAVAVLALHRLGHASLAGAAGGAASAPIVPRAEHRERHTAMHAAFEAAFEHNAPILDRLNR